MIYYLYVKTHNKTGLKYLGKTELNPYVYKGSGLYWKCHLKKYGNDVFTELIGAFDTLDDLRVAGQFWSEKWNVVESQEWANLRVEEGDGGGPGIPKGISTRGKGWHHSPNTKLKISQSVAKNHPFKGKVGPNKGRKWPVEMRQRISKSLLGNTNKKGKRKNHVTIA